MEPDGGLEVRETDGVYRPSEDSYLLLKAIDLSGASTFLDIGTGTGIIALHAARKVRTIATDIADEAVKLCRSNASSNGLSVEVVRADLFGGLRISADVIAFNPPYLPDVGPEILRDPAWSGGPDGNRVISRFLNEAHHHLVPRGRIYALVSSYNTRALSRASALYSIRRVARKSLFFEEIAVYELAAPEQPPVQ